MVDVVSPSQFFCSCPRVSRHCGFTCSVMAPCRNTKSRTKTPDIDDRTVTTLFSQGASRRLHNQYCALNHSRERIPVLQEPSLCTVKDWIITSASCVPLFAAKPIRSTRLYRVNSGRSGVTRPYLRGVFLLLGKPPLGGWTRSTARVSRISGWGVAPPPRSYAALRIFSEKTLQTSTRLPLPCMLPDRLTREPI